MQRTKYVFRLVKVESLWQSLLKW